MKELVFENALCSADGGLLDGPCKLPSQLGWPEDSDGFPLFHLMSIPLNWVVANFNNGSTEARWLSVFVSYDKANYSHYGKMSSDEPEHKDAVVILHDMTGEDRSMHPDQAPSSKNVKLAPAIDRDDNVASYIDSVPVWVQDPIQLDKYKWVLSVYGPDMDESLGDNGGILSDGIGYVFLKTGAKFDSFGTVGKFFLQL